MWGTDQAASLEPNGISRLVRDIRLWEQSMGDGVKRVYDEDAHPEEAASRRRRNLAPHDKAGLEKDALAGIKALALDVDGTLTDGGL